MFIDPNLKEFKYTQCFLSDRNASCNRCGTRSWKKGHKIYGGKKPDGKWAFCSDKKCYQEQGGKLTLHDEKNITIPDVEQVSSQPPQQSIEQQPIIKQDLYPIECYRCSKMFGYSDRNFSDIDELHTENYCTSCIVMTVKEKSE